MRWVMALLGAAVFLQPTAAAADPADCARMLRQILHYEDMAERADELGNEMWAERTRDHVELLDDRLDARCPSYSRRDHAAEQAARQLARMMKIAASAVTKFFTMGAM